MAQIILLILIFLGIPIIYVLCSNPTPQKELSRYSPLFKSSLRSNCYPPENEVFKTLKDAGLEPCFLEHKEGSQ